jgi:hypothetical protein
MTPKTLFMYNQQKNEESGSGFCERRRVVKDFCFPDGIELSLIKGPGADLSKVKYSTRIQ